MLRLWCLFISLCCFLPAVMCTHKNKEMSSWDSTSSDEGIVLTWPNCKRWFRFCYREIQLVELLPFPQIPAAMRNVPRSSSKGAWFVQKFVNCWCNVDSWLPGWKSWKNIFKRGVFIHIVSLKEIVCSSWRPDSSLTWVPGLRSGSVHWRKETCSLLWRVIHLAVGL